jgi:hypothetical protein
LIAAAALLVLLPLTTPASGDGGERWLEDLHFVVQNLREIHPEPYLRTTEAAFTKSVAMLKAAIPKLDNAEVVARLMELVASIGDGHTLLLPTGVPEFQARFPVRVHRFHDGLYVASIRRDLAHLAGGRITRVGNIAAEEAYEKVARVAPADGEFGRRITASMFFQTASLLHALGVTESPETLHLTVLTPDGATEQVSLEAVTPEDGFLGYSRRPLTPPGGTDCVHPFSNSTGELPLHLRGLMPDLRVMWFEHLRQRRTLYVQLNLIGNTPEETFAAFTKRLWDYYDGNAAGIDKLIIDLRHNTGGNGFLLRPFVHELIKHDAINQPGRLYALVGNSTFSAAVSLLAQMIEHTEVTVVGEPTAGPLNWCSDTQALSLPNSGMILIVSTLCWQKGHPSDTRGHAPPDFAILTSGADFLAGRDPVLDAVLGGRILPLDDVLREEGALAFMEEYREQMKRLSSLAWWPPFTETDLNSLGYEMLTAGRLDDAIAAFTLNTERHPESWNVWDSLGGAYHRKSDLDRAEESYQKSLQLNAENANARAALESIQDARQGQVSD